MFVSRPLAAVVRLRFLAAHPTRCTHRCTVVVVDASLPVDATDDPLRWGMPLMEFSCSHIVSSLPLRLVFGEQVLPFPSCSSIPSNSLMKSSQSLSRSSMVKSIVCSDAQSPPIRMTEFVTRPDLAGVNSMESRILVLLIPGGSRLPPVEHASGIFLVPRFSCDIPDVVYPVEGGFCLCCHDSSSLSSLFLVPSWTLFSSLTLSRTFDMRSASLPGSLSHTGMKG